MSLAWMYYLMSTVSSLGCFFSGLGGIVFLVMVIKFCQKCGSVGDAEDAEKKKEKQKEYDEYVKNGWKKYISISVLFFLISALIPTKKDVLIMGGLSLGDDTIKSTITTTNKIIPRLGDLIEKEITDILDKDKKRGESGK